MKNKKILGVYSIIHNDKIQSLRSFLNNTKQMYDYQKINLSNSDFVSYLKSTCYDIEVEINSTNAYYESNKAISTEIREALEKCEDLSILFLKYISELNELGIDKNEFLSFRKERKDAFDFDLEPKKKKEPVDNHLEIAKEFKEILDSIKIEVPENNDKSKSKKLNDEDDLKFQVCLNFANGKIYELHSKGFSHPKKAEELFKNHDKTNSIIGFIKNTYNNISKDKDNYNKSKNLFNNIELITFVKKHCIEKGIEINSTFLKECNKNNPKELD